MFHHGIAMVKSGTYIGMPKKTHGNILAVCGVVQPSEAMVGLLPGAESSSGLGHLPLGVFSGHDTPQKMCSLRM